MPMTRFVLSMVLAFFAASLPAADILLLPDRVWTADGDTSHSGWSVLIRDGAIAKVGPKDASDAKDATRVELPGTGVARAIFYRSRQIFEGYASRPHG